MTGGHILYLAKYLFDIDLQSLKMSDSNRIWLSFSALTWVPVFIIWNNFFACWNFVDFLSSILINLVALKISSYDSVKENILLFTISGLLIIILPWLRFLICVLFPYFPRLWALFFFFWHPMLMGWVPLINLST
jgi:hypothetical protein